MSDADYLFADGDPQRVPTCWAWSNTDLTEYGAVVAAQAREEERQAIAAYLLIEARSYAHHVGDALTAEEASGAFSALIIAAQAIRSGEHVKP